MFHPVRHAIAPHLETILSARERSEEHEAAAFLLVKYIDDPGALIGWLRHAQAAHVPLILDRLSAAGEAGARRLEDAFSRPDPAAGGLERVNLALAVMALGRGEGAWSLLRHGEDDGLRTALIHRFAPARVDAEVLVRRLASEPDASIRRALILALGEYPTSQLSVPERDPLTQKLLEFYVADPDPGVHSAVDWLLRRWGQTEALKAQDRSLSSTGPIGERGWYVDKHGHTLAVVPGPVTFTMGSPDSEPGRRRDETLHRTRIDRSFAVATKETTYTQFLRFNKAAMAGGGGDAGEDFPICSRSYLDAAMYCRWLSLEEGLPEEQVCYPPSPSCAPGVSSRTPTT